MLKVLQRYFVRIDEGYVNTRLENEIQRSNSISKNRADAGHKGAIALQRRRKALSIQARKEARQMLGKYPSSAQHLPLTPSPSPTPTLNTNPKKTKVKHTSENADAFSRFWSAYPKKQGKVEAEKVWHSIKPDLALTDTIVRAIAAAKKSDDWSKESGRYIPQPARYLRNRRWEDELQAERDQGEVL